MARICAACRQPVSPIDECICPDEPEVPELPADGEELA